MMGTEMLRTLLLISLITSCAWQNPMKSIKTDIATFRAIDPPHFVTYQTKHRKMSFAWNGDVTKRPLILVHGSPGSWEAWAAFLQNPKLTENFHIIAVDRPGYGESSAGTSERNLGHQADDIVEALQFNKSGLPALLVGHSFGGPVIAQIAVNHPAKIAGLIFVASSVDPELEDIKWYQHLGTWWPFRVILPTDLRVCNEEIYALKPELEALAKGIPQISVPVIIIHGDEDPLVPVENVGYLEKKIKADLVVETSILQGMNHFVPWKAPQVIVDAILKLGAL